MGRAGLNKERRERRANRGISSRKSRPELSWEDPKSLAGPQQTLANKNPKTYFVTEDFRTAEMLVRTR